jgi:protein-S-isoprenylcysteine O-methyltransferase Ste14
MARQWFKRVWTKVVPQQVERSTYVLATNFVLLALIHLWQPMTAVIWEVETEAAVITLHGLFWLGWLVVLVSTFLIDHFELFGLKQVWKYWRNQTFEPPTFQTPGPYKFVRHPLYVGFFIAFWSAPQLTLGHLYFAGMCTAYILLAIQFEERDLMRIHGEDYKVYRSGVSMLVPWPRTRKPR